jgi:hypothetical protein
VQQASPRPSPVKTLLQACNFKGIGEAMKIENSLRKNKSTVAAAILALVILVPIGYYAIGDAFSRNADPFLEKVDPKHTECVRDIPYMRFHHMDLLKEVREQVVREGNREQITLEKISLENCMECHTNRSRFCNQCHNEVNLHLDCFGCHNYPESPQETMMTHSSKSSVSAIAGLSEPSP